MILWFLRTAIVITVRIKTMAAKFRDGDTVYYQGDSSAYVFAHSDDQRILPSYIGVLTLTLIACIFFMWVPITRYVIVGVAITSIITTFFSNSGRKKAIWPMVSICIASFVMFVVSSLMVNFVDSVVTTGSECSKVPDDQVTACINAINKTGEYEVVE